MRSALRAEQASGCTQEEMVVFSGGVFQFTCSLFVLNNHNQETAALFEYKTLHKKHTPRYCLFQY